MALATPPGVGAIGIVRLSGKKSISIVNQLFPSKDLSKEPSHTLHVGFIKEEEKDIDEVSELANRSMIYDKFTPALIQDKSFGDPYSNPKLNLVMRDKNQIIGFKIA